MTGATVAESPNEFLVLATIPAGMVGAVTRLHKQHIFTSSTNDTFLHFTNDTSSHLRKHIFPAAKGLA